MLACSFPLLLTFGFRSSFCLSIAVQVQRLFPQIELQHVQLLVVAGGLVQVVSPFPLIVCWLDLSRE